MILDRNEVTATFQFKLPLLCDELKVSCGKLTQYCHQGDAKCLCKPGYQPSTDLEFPYDPNPSIPNAFIDGNHLDCVPICKNGGDYDTESGSCTCPPHRNW